MKGKLIKSVAGSLAKHRGTIYTIGSIAGTLAAVYFAAKDAPKVVAKLDELNEREAKPLEKAKELAPLVARTAVATGVSIGCTLANRKFASDAIHTLSDALAVKNMTEELTKKYTAEIAGEEVAEKVQAAVVREQAVNSGVPTAITAPKVIQTGHGNDLFYDEWSGRWFVSDISFIKESIVSLNYQLMNDMYVSLNEVYQYLDLPTVGSGRDFGWNCDYGTIELDVRAQLDETDRPYTILSFRNEPVARWDSRGRW